MSSPFSQDLLISEEQKELVALIKDFAEKKVKPVVEQCDRDDTLPMEVYEEAMEMGLHMTVLPEEVGGMGLDHLTNCLIMEELAKVDAGFAVGCSANGLACEPIMIGGTKEQQKYFASVLSQKKFAAFCLTEADAGSDVAGGRTKAVFDAEKNEWVINGTKCFITNGGVASIYVVFAITEEGGNPYKSMSAFIVERDLPGVSVGKKEDKMGIRLSSTTEVIFEDVRVPADHLVGGEAMRGKGFKLAMMVLDSSRPTVGSMACGIAQRAIDECVEYANTRKTFGKPLSANQAIAFKLADMEMTTQVARQYCHYAAQVQDSGIKPYSKLSSIAKCFAGDNAVRVATEAIQIFGGYGYSKEYPIEKLLRDAKIYQIFEGTNEIQRIVIAGSLLKGY
ncbi:MAG: acyl-CoA dehydrogenase family protein [Clostridia bacterium]|nr:acyl-CoA dehydrogenase family protein [Clostridia bacterium]